MKQLIVIIILLSAQNLYSEEMRAFPLKIYTPHIVVDKKSEGSKGAVQLLWKKMNEESHYEVEVSNGVSTYSNVDDKHFHHVMIYFDKDYYWRVRQVDIDKRTRFSPWRPLKVVRGESQNRVKTRQLSSQKGSEKSGQDQYLLDVGG